MSTQAFRGLAQVSGILSALDVIVYPVAQTGKLTHNFQLEVEKDNVGQDCAWRAQNEFVDGDLVMKLLGDTAAHAATGGAFLAPLAVVTLSTFKVATWNTTYIVVPGGDLDQKNDATSSITFKLRKYVDATQNALFAATPS